MNQSAKQTIEAQQPSQPLQILYQDEHCIAINKPAGMLVHRSWLAKHETQFVMQTLRDQIGQHVFPIHRLDRPTSGVLLFALDSDSARQLSQAFEHRQVSKTYWAVVRGYMGKINGEDKDDGRIDYPLSIIKDKIADKHSLANDKRKMQQIERLENKSINNDKQTQDAVTDWQVLATSEQPFQARARFATSRYSWLELKPHTGRKHQLRRHMKHIFHPIIGDTSYGDHHQNRAIREHIGVSRLMLHARSLTFVNLAGEMITVTAPIDNDWQMLMDRFGWG